MKFYWIGILFLASFSAQGATIAYIGDSQSAVSYGLLSRLRSPLQLAGHELRSGRAVCGSRIQNYIEGGANGVCRYSGVTYMQLENGTATFPQGSGQTASVDTLMQDTDTVVVQLGDNHLQEAAQARTHAQNLVRRILSQGKRCVWIGPAAVPNTSACQTNRQRKQAVNEALEAALSDPEFIREMNGQRCEFINSFELTAANPPNSGDCLHYTDYQPWADAISDTLLRSLATPTSAPSPTPATSSEGSDAI